MTGKNISKSVNRAFRTIGGLFMFGGLYLGTLMWLDAPVVLSVTGVIEDIRIEKERPLGFENIPVDSKDPDHENTPLNINTFAIVEYQFEGVPYSAEIVSWNEEVNWQFGDTIPLYFLENEPEYPTNYVSDNKSNAKITPIIAGLAMFFAGLVFSLVTAWQKRRDIKNKEKLLDSIDRIKRPYSSGRISHDNPILLDEKNRGNYFMGGILSAIGLILFLAMLSELITSDDMFNRLISVFPFVLSIGILYMGLSDFYSDRVILSTNDVRLIHKALWGRFDRSEPINSFGGIVENKIEHEKSGSAKRFIYREQALVHRDPRFHETRIKLIPDDAKAVEAARDFAKKLDLPRVLYDGDRLFLEYPDGEKVKSRDDDWDPDSTIDPSRPFPGKTLKLTDNSTGHLHIVRSYRMSLIWSFVCIATGAGLFIATGYGAVLFPFLMFGLIFGFLGMKGERFEIVKGILVIEKFWFGKSYGVKKIHLKQLDDILIGNDTLMNNAECLEIIGKGERIYFGQAAKSDELKWIQARVREMKSMYYA